MRGYANISSMKGVEYMQMEMYQNPTGEFTTQEKRYLNYIKDHIAKVRKSFDERIHVIERVLGLSSAEMQEMITRIENHDLSKYTVDEFPNYRNWFYPDEGEVKNDAGFAWAWTHHWKNNDHHPEFWVRNNTPLPMTKTAIAEMILDWEAMSRAFGGNPRTWFEQSGKSLPFHPETLQIVKRALNIIYNEDLNLKEYRSPILG